MSWWLAGGISSGDCVLAYAPIGASDATAARVNLANPGTYDATTGSAPTWGASTGWSFNGSQWLRSNYSVDSVVHTLMIRFANIGTGSGNDYRIGSEVHYVSPKFGGGGSRIYSYTNFNNPSGELTNGTMAQAGGNSYLNGAADGTLTAASGLVREYVVGARGTVGSQPMVGDIVAYAIYSRVLNSTEMAALHTAMMGLPESNKIPVFMNQYRQRRA